MAKQANNMMIGGFVVIAVFLLAASVVIFGSGKFFRETDTYVLHFDGSIKGLNVGAQVLAQGVPIGRVSNIVMRTSRKNQTMDIVVYIEIEPDRFQVVDEKEIQRDPAMNLPILIDRGLRAVLTTQSLITGQLLIELDYYPDTPVNLKGADPDYLEIPTIPSTTERLYQTLQNIDFAGMANHLEETMSGIDRFVNNPDLTGGIHSLKLTIEELHQVIAKVNVNVDAIVDDVEGTLGDARSLISKADHQVEPLAGNLQRVLENIDMLTRNADAKLETVATDLDKSLTGFRGVLSEDAPLIIKLEETLRDISTMANYMRQLADYLERHPEALIQGKTEYGGK